MEGVFDKAGYLFEEVERKDFPDLGLEKALNELVYRLKRKEKGKGERKRREGGQEGRRKGKERSIGAVWTPAVGSCPWS